MSERRARQNAQALIQSAEEMRRRGRDLVKETHSETLSVDAMERISTLEDRVRQLTGHLMNQERVLQSILQTEINVVDDRKTA